MSLMVWLPLNGNLENQGLSGVKPTISSPVYSSGKIGQCLLLDREFDTTLPSTDWDYITNSCSFGCWVKVSLADLQTIADWKTFDSVYKTMGGTLLGQDSYGGVALRWQTNDLSSSKTITKVELYGHIRNTDSTAQYTNTYILPFDTWTHVVLVINRTTQTMGMYINGKLFSEKSIGWITGSFYTGNFLICQSSWDGGNGISSPGKFSLNDVRVYDHALSAKEVGELAKGLVLHYPLRDQYIENTTNISSQTTKGGWNNSGSSIRETNNVDLIKNAPYPANVYSIKVTTAGNCALTFGYTTSNVPSKTLTCSVYCYLSGTQDGEGIYIRSSKTDGSLGYFSYNGTTDPRSWPLNKWIRLERTITTNSEATTIYFCTYADVLNNIRAFCGWQIEEKDHATPFTPSSRSETIAYDCSGYRRNGTKSGIITCDFDSPRYAKSYKFGSNSYISLLNPNLSNNINGNSANITIAVWAKNSSSSPNALLVGYGSSAAQNKFLLCHLYNNGQVGLCYYSNDLWGSIPNFDINKWYHIVYVISGMNRKIYVNGVLNSQQTVSSTLSIDEANAKLMIGRDIIRNNYGASNISDVRIYATALSAEDIAELYHSAVIVDNTGKTYAYEYFEAN